MRSQHRPGTYLTGFPHPDGSDMAQCRCAVCWAEWFVDSAAHLDILLGATLLLQCPMCGQIREYKDADPSAETKTTAKGILPKVRKKRGNVDPPLFSGFDPGYDVRHKGHK